MTTPHQALGQALLLQGSGPPTEVLIFPYGLIRTTKGIFHFTPKSAELVKAQWAQLGRQFGFDYGHDEFNAQVPSKDKIAAGWGDLELRADGVWCVRVTWTPEASRKIAARELRYTSPAFTAKGGEITSLLNCALTNFPATHSPRPLVLSAGGHLPGMPMNPKLMLRAFGALLAAAQAAAEGDNPALKDIGVKLAAELPPHIAKLKEAFPDVGEGEEDDAEDAKQKELQAVYEAACTLTGAKEGIVGALHALKAQASQRVQAAGASEELVKAAFVDRLIKETRQVHPQDRKTFLAMSMKDLQSYQKSAPRIGPPSGEAQGAVQLSGQPPEQAEVAAAEAVVAEMMGYGPAKE